MSFVVVSLPPLLRPRSWPSRPPARASASRLRRFTPGASPNLSSRYVEAAVPGLGLRDTSCAAAGPIMAAIFLEGATAHDALAGVFTAAAMLAVLRFYEELAKLGVVGQILNRKLVHISAGLVFMLCWPLFSSSRYAPYFAVLAPGLNIFRMLFLGLGITRNDGLIKSMTRTGNFRELLEGPLYYACSITLVSAVLWRESPTAIAVICNLCAGDGMADIAGRRLGWAKLPYNQNKSYAGSTAMFLAGFVASIGFMCYFHSFGFMERTWPLAIGFLAVSAFATLVESFPVSSDLDDNLTVPLASLLVGSLVF